ncbi:MAG: hemerythrin domain-containing protein [Burkholderiales bacterium]|nr:hemerythrin domain-containing protein [Burkholderiales bacterium]
MIPTSLRIINEEHAALAAMLKALHQRTQQGPGDAPQAFFGAMRAMLFYIDEFPERQHHPKESEWLFPRVAARSAEAASAIEQLDRDHEGGEAAVRELQHLLLAWELLGESRRATFAGALVRYNDFYLAHMRLEEAVVLPAALAELGADDWHAIDQAFATNDLLLTPGVPRDPAFDALYTRIWRSMPDGASPG